jgi:hypothetical protein
MGSNLNCLLMLLILGKVYSFALINDIIDEFYFYIILIDISIIKNIEKISYRILMININDQPI